MREKGVSLPEPRWLQVTSLVVDVLGISAIALLTGVLAAKAFFPGIYYGALKLLGQ